MDVDGHQIRVAGSGGGGLVALLGTVLDDRPLSLLCDHTLSDFLSVVESQDSHVELSWLVPGLLRDFDLPDLVATLAPRRCTLLNAIDSPGNAFPEAALRALYKVAMDSYSSLGSPDVLQIITSTGEPKSHEFMAWLKNV